MSSVIASVVPDNRHPVIMAVAPDQGGGEALVQPLPGKARLTLATQAGGSLVKFNHKSAKEISGKLQAALDRVAEIFYEEHPFFALQWIDYVDGSIRVRDLQGRCHLLDDSQISDVLRGAIQELTNTSEKVARFTPVVASDKDSNRADTGSKPLEIRHNEKWTQNEKADFKSCEQKGLFTELQNAKLTTEAIASANGRTAERFITEYQQQLQEKKKIVEDELAQLPEETPADIRKKKQEQVSLFQSVLDQLRDIRKRSVFAAVAVCGDLAAAWQLTPDQLMEKAQGLRQFYQNYLGKAEGNRGDNRILKDGRMSSYFANYAHDEGALLLHERRLYQAYQGLEEMKVGCIEEHIVHNVRNLSNPHFVDDLRSLGLNKPTDEIDRQTRNLFVEAFNATKTKLQSP